MRSAARWVLYIAASLCVNWVAPSWAATLPLSVCVSFSVASVCASPDLHPTATPAPTVPLEFGQGTEGLPTSIMSSTELRQADQSVNTPPPGPSWAERNGLFGSNIGFLLKSTSGKALSRTHVMLAVRALCVKDEKLVAEHLTLAGTKRNGSEPPSHLVVVDRQHDATVKALEAHCGKPITITESGTATDAVFERLVPERRFKHSLIVGQSVGISHEIVAQGFEQLLKAKRLPADYTISRKRDACGQFSLSAPAFVSVPTIETFEALKGSYITVKDVIAVRCMLSVPKAKSTAASTSVRAGNKTGDVTHKPTKRGRGHKQQATRTTIGGPDAQRVCIDRREHQRRWHRQRRGHRAH